MLLSPLLLVAAGQGRAAAPCRRAQATLPELSEPQSAPVIIAGFGRYGQIVGRLLAAQGVATTVLDHDADMIEAARAFGSKVFYGDATRLDLLRIAGAGSARVLVVAVDDRQQSLRHRRPGARALSAPGAGRAGARRDALERAARPRRDARGARAVRIQPAQRPHRAGTARARRRTRRAAWRCAFAAHNIALFEQMYPHHQDRAKLIAVVKQGRQQFEEQMARERADAAARRRARASAPQDWDDEPGRRDA